MNQLSSLLLLLTLKFSTEVVVHFALPGLTHDGLELYIGNSFWLKSYPLYLFAEQKFREYSMHFELACTILTYNSNQ